MTYFLKSQTRMLEIIAKLETENENKFKSVLELGCGAGFLVKELVDRGYDAKGIDLNKEYFIDEGIEKGYLQQNIFLNVPSFSKNYDLMIACRVMGLASNSALLRNSSKDYNRDTPFNYSLHPRKITEEIAQQNNKDILSAAEQKLKPRGYFIATEDSGDYEEIFLKEEDIHNSGLHIIKFSPTEMVLRK